MIDLIVFVIFCFGLSVYTINVFHKIKVNNALIDLSISFKNIELFAITKQLPVTGELKEFIARHKFYAYNPHIIEWETLVMLYELTGEEKRGINKSRWDFITSKLPTELVELSNDFNNHFVKVVHLRAKRPSSIIRRFIASIKFLFTLGYSAWAKFWEDVNRATSCDPQLLYKIEKGSLS